MSTLSEPRRPRILAQNRKLRHLKGVWLRNLSYAPTHLRSADDAVVGGGGGGSGSSSSPQNHRSRLGRLHETSPLQHSRSSDNLRRTSLNATEAAALRPQRPRRMSLSVGQTPNTPGSRQKALEELADSAVGDAFLTLHVRGEDEPIYVSEVRHRSANFNFAFFDLSDCPPRVSRSCQLTVRVWVRRPKSSSWTFLLDETMDLRRLNFISTLADRRFPTNALVFHLEDGIYSLDFPNRISEPKQAPAIPTASFSTLMKLANLESSIDDAMATQADIVGQINRILGETPADASGTAAEEARLADKYVAAQRRANRVASRRRDDLRESLDRRRSAIAGGREAEARAADDMAASREKLEVNRAMAERTEQQIHGQRRRICSDLNDAFPITPVPNAPPLSFRICGIPLPNSVYDASTARALNEDVLSAGLGLVALLVHHLQFYLSRPLPYPLSPLGSRSHARDDISILLADRGSVAPSASASASSPPRSNHRRDFPLYLPRGGSTTGQWRFEYAWFLLNKDIEALCSSQGLRVVDIRHTLPNLKYLLYVGCAGSDEVPERRRGGVRGLWLGRLRGRLPAAAAAAAVADDADGGSSTGATSRTASVDSDLVNRHSEALRSAVVGDGAADGGGIVPRPVVSLPFGEGDAKFTLRTRGLRENIG